MRDGTFIVFEGIDGSGTTTQSKLAADWLRAKGVQVVLTSEPTDRAIGRVIRMALSRRLPGREGDEIEPELFALLFAADRLDHMKAKVIPALERGHWVLSDRCYLSSLAYQSVGCELDWVRALNRHVRKADLTILLDLDPNAAHERLLAGRTSREVFESVEMMAAVRANYLRIAGVLAAEGERIVRIDSGAPIDDVAAQVCRAVSELL